MFRRPHYIALSIVLLLVLIIWSLPSQTATQLKLALGGFFLPLLGLAGSTQSLADRTSHALVPRRALIDQIEKLQREVQQLRLHAIQSTQVWQENAQLREALGWRAQSQWKPKCARVILRDPANWWHTIQISVGQRDGVVTNLPVLTTDGLIGKIWQVGYSSSQVVLIGDPNCRVSARVDVEDQREKTVHGVIVSSGSSVLDPTIVRLTFLTRTTAIKPGQKVFTSGLGGVFPVNILIGNVVDTTSVGFGVYTEARVKLTANLKNLEEVWVLFP